MSSLLLLKSMLFAKSLQNQPKVKKKKIKQMADKISTRISTTVQGVKCRICDQDKAEIPIFDNFVEPNLPEDIQHFSGVTMNKSDIFSNHMCQRCLDLLNGCNIFKEMCQRTNKKLHEMDIIKKESNLDANMTCNVSDEYNETERPESDGVDLFEDYDTDITCSFCGKNFFEWGLLNSHLEKCKKKKQNDKLQAKPNEEKPQRRFLCDVCGKTAHSRANLAAHKTIHVAIFPFKCEECPYMGRTMDLLKVHKRSHLTEKPFKCPECLKGTTTSSNLAKHMRHVHSSTRPYKCSYCDKGFSSQHDMKRHIKDIHLRQGTVECELCFKKFNTRKILRGHQWKVHKIKGERQGRLPAYLQWQMEEQNVIHIEKVERQEEMFLT